jgi:hypothetical protein
MFAVIDREAIVIFIICFIVLAFFVIAGVRDIYRRRDDE